jgi:hypothetical protein
MDAIVLLADYAQAINGKLYIQGGGWSRIVPPPMPGLPPGVCLVPCALAVRFLVGWEEANKKHTVIIRLLDEDGHPVSPAVPPDQPPIEVTTQLEVGRPPGLVEGTDLDAALAVNFQGLPLTRKRYQFTLEIDGQQVKTGAFFDVV